MGASDARAEMLIQSSAQSCFDAFVKPEATTKFWLQKTSGPLAAGATVDWEFMVPGAKETVTVTDFSAPSHLTFSWSDDIKVEKRFDSQGTDATVVRVLSKGFKTAKEAVDATEGFSIVLCDLKTLLDSGASADLVRDKAELIAAVK